MLSATVFGVFILSVVLVLGNVFKEILPMLVNSNLPLSFVLKFIALVLPLLSHLHHPVGPPLRGAPRLRPDQRRQRARLPADGRFKHAANLSACFRRRPAPFLCLSLHQCQCLPQS